MRIVMTLVLRDEAEIVSDHLDYHLAAGVDFVIATDHRSADGTREILGEYERRGVLRLLREDGEYIRQGAWQTRMGQLAALEHDAEWVLVSDADEFWFPRSESLVESLRAVPASVGVVHASMQNFVPIHGGEGRFAERMTYRLSPKAPINDPATPYRPVVKVAHRADPDAYLSRGGGHRVSGVRGDMLSAWRPLDLLHFPIRTREQCARKYRKTWTGWESNLRGDIALARETASREREDAVWDRVALGPDEIARGLERGALVLDTRLRDALRIVRGIDAPQAEAEERGGREVHTGLADRAVFSEAQLVRSARRLDELEARVSALEPVRGRAGVRPH